MQPQGRVKVRLEASVSPSEDRAKVEAALRNVLGECKSESSSKTNRVVLASEDPGALMRIHDQLRDRHVRSASRKTLLMGKEDGRTVALLNRQAAAAGVVALCREEQESPLGPIYITIEAEDLDGVIQWLTD